MGPMPERQHDAPHIALIPAAGVGARFGAENPNNMLKSMVNRIATHHEIFEQHSRIDLMPLFFRRKIRFSDGPCLRKCVSFE